MSRLADIREIDRIIGNSYAGRNKSVFCVLSEDGARSCITGGDARELLRSVADEIADLVISNAQSRENMTAELYAFTHAVIRKAYSEWNAKQQKPSISIRIDMTSEQKEILLGKLKEDQDGNHT